ncbi:MAG: DNA polymerase III subunit alpha, partial [Chloroflexi bacterium]|nr:DNA polymerase III subunit alpha [Chloroflexota bacterium]
QACRDFGIRPIIGCEVTMVGGHHLTLLAETRQGYGNLCWLISQAYRADRRNPALDPSLFEGRTNGLIALSGCRRGQVPSLLDQGRFVEAHEVAQQYRDRFGVKGYFLEMQQHLVHGDTRRNRRLASLAQEIGVGLVATGNVHYHVRERHRLQDCLVAIQHNASLEECHRERRPNSEFFLKPPSELVRLFRWRPEAIQNAARIAQRCAAFDLSQDLGYEFPDYPVPEGYTPQTYLERLCNEAAERRYRSVTAKVRDRLAHEFRLLEKHNLAGFFLIYHDVVQMAQEVAVDLGLVDPETPVEVNPPGRGRGSSVSMLVGYLLGMSHIDPLDYDLSLDRFLPDDKLDIVPDIDLDFPRNIREELILRVHAKYGWERAALTGMISTYHMRGAVRDLGKALGLPADQIDKLAKRTDERDGLSLRQIMLELPDFRDKVTSSPASGSGQTLWHHFIALADELDGFPRQLAQHPGGMIISSRPLTEIVPVQPSAIEGRYVMHWDKDSIDYARFVKIDFLGLGALSQMQDALRAIKSRTGEDIDLSRIDFNDLAVYADLHKADTIGVFQVESAAQMQTITRIRPKNLTDMAHEVAAVRPGVGANQGVHRYILRRAGLEPLEFDHDLERPVLERTWGIILFQDQINHLAMAVAGFGATEADRMRRAFAKRHNEPAIHRYWERFRDGAHAKGVDEETARRIFKKFNGHYMVPESHAFAFGIT